MAIPDDPDIEVRAVKPKSEAKHVISVIHTVFIRGFRITITVSKDKVEAKIKPKRGLSRRWVSQIDFNELIDDIIKKEAERNEEDRKDNKESEGKGRSE